MHAKSPCCGIGTTINSCFIARSWHVHTKGGFAGTCIGVVLMGITVELVRRVQRELDRHLLAKWLARQRAARPQRCPGCS